MPSDMSIAGGFKTYCFSTVLGIGANKNAHLMSVDQHCLLQFPANTSAALNVSAGAPEA